MKTFFSLQNLMHILRIQYSICQFWLILDSDSYEVPIHRCRNFRPQVPQGNQSISLQFHEHGFLKSRQGKIKLWLSTRYTVHSQSCQSRCYLLPSNTADIPPFSGLQKIRVKVNWKKKNGFAQFSITKTE